MLTWPRLHRVHVVVAGLLRLAPNVIGANRPAKLLKMPGVDRARREDTGRSGDQRRQAICVSIHCAQIHSACMCSLSNSRRVSITRRLTVATGISFGIRAIGRVFASAVTHARLRRRTADLAIDGADGGDPWCDHCEGFHPRPTFSCGVAEPAMSALDVLLDADYESRSRAA